MTKLILDKSKPYAEIHGSGGKASFSQTQYGRERFFDAQGRRVYMPIYGDHNDDDVRGAAGPTTTIATAPPRAKPGRPPKSAGTKVATAKKPGRPPKAKAPSPADDADDEGQPPAPPEADDGEVNLTLWAQGAALYPFQKVRKAIEERFSTMVMNESDAIKVLIDNKVVLMGELAAKYRD